MGQLRSGKPWSPMARLGYSEYTTVDNVWRMRRPG
jgi:hypothetical protein